MEDLSVSQNENDKTERLRRRLSSILKVPRAPLQDLGGGNERLQDHLLEKRRKHSRRVSFAETLEARSPDLQARPEGQIGADSRKPSPSEPGSTQNARCRIAGMDTLLHAPVQTRLPRTGDTDQTTENKTVLFSGDDMDMTASNSVIITRNLLEKSEADSKSCKIDITSFLAALGSKSRVSKANEEFPSLTQCTAAKSTFFNVLPNTSGSFENKINVDAFLASLKPAARPVDASLHCENKENLLVSAVGGFHGRSSNTSAIALNTQAYPPTRENPFNLTQIYKDQADSIDLTRCHTTNIENVFAADFSKPFDAKHIPGTSKPEHKATCSSQENEKDPSQGNAFSNPAFEKQSIYPLINTKPSVRNRDSVIGFENTSDEEMDFTKCHSVQIDRTNVQASRNLNTLPMLHQDLESTGAFFPGDKTRIFDALEQEMDITRNDTCVMSCRASAGSLLPGNETSQRAGTASSFPSERTVHFLQDDMDVTRSHTVAIDGEGIGPSGIREQEICSIPESSLLKVSHSHNDSGSRRHVFGSTVSKTAKGFLPSRGGPPPLELPGEKTILFSCEDMNVTGNVGSVETSSKFTHRQSPVGKHVSSNEEQLMEASQSHTVFIESQGAENPGQVDFRIGSVGSLCKSGDFKARSFGAPEMFGDLPLDPTFTGVGNDMDLTGECTSLKNSHLYMQENADPATNISKEQNDSLALTQSHTCNIERVFPTATDVGSEALVFWNTGSACGDRMAKIGNCPSDAIISRKSVHVLSSKQNHSVEENSESNIFDILKIKKNASRLNIADPALPQTASRSGSGEGTVLIEEDMDLSTFHTVLIESADTHKQATRVPAAIPVLDRNSAVHSEMRFLGDEANFLAGSKTRYHTAVNSSSNLRGIFHPPCNDEACRAGRSNTVLYPAYDMDITQSHTVAIDGQIIEQSPRNMEMFQLASDMDTSTRQETTIGGAGLTQTANVSHTANARSPVHGRSLVIQLPSDKTIGFLNEDMNLTRVFSPNVNPKAVGQYGLPPKNTGASSRKSLPRRSKADFSNLMLAEEMDMTESHTCYIDDQSIGMPVQQNPRSDVETDAKTSVAENKPPGVIPFEPSTEQIRVDDPTILKNLKQKDILGLSVSFGTKPILFGDDMDTHLTQPSVLIHETDVGTISKSNVWAAKQFYAGPSMQDSSCNVTHVFKEDNLLEVTQCHTTNIKSFVPADGAANSKWAVAQKKSKVFGDEGHETVAHPKNMPRAAEDASEGASNCRLRDSESAVQHIGSEVGYDRKTILDMPKENVSATVETPIGQKTVNQNLRTTATLAVIPAPPYSEDCLQSGEHLLFPSADDMEMTCYHTVIINSQKTGGPGYCCTDETSRTAKSMLSPAVDDMDITKSLTVAIDQQLQTLRSLSDNKEIAEDPTRDNIADGVEVNSPEKLCSRAKKNSFQTSHRSSLLFQFPYGKPVSLGEGNHLTEGFNPATDNQELGRWSTRTSKYFGTSPEFSSVSAVLKGQQDMDVTESQTVLISGPNIAMPVNQTHASENPGCIETPHFLLNHAEPFAEYTASGMGYESRTLCDVEMDITKCHTVDLEKVHAQKNLNPGTATLLTGLRPRNALIAFPTETSRFSAGDLMDITRSSTVGIDQKIVRQLQSNTQAFQSLSHNEQRAGDLHSRPTTDERELNSTGNWGFQVHKNRFQASFCSSEPSQLLSDQSVFCSEDMNLTKGFSVATNGIETRRPYACSSEDTGTVLTFGKLLPPSDRSASSVSKGNSEMEITHSHAVFIVDLHSEMPEETMGSKVEDHLSKSGPVNADAEPCGTSAQQINLNGDSTHSLKLKPWKSLNSPPSPGMRMVFFEESDNMDVTTYTKPKALSAAEKAYSRLNTDENACNVTCVQHMDDRIDVTQCHTTNIESFVPVADSDVLKQVDVKEDDCFGENKTEPQMSVPHSVVYSDHNTNMETAQTLGTKNALSSCLLRDTESALQCTALAKGSDTKTLIFNNVMETQSENGAFHNEGDSSDGGFSSVADDKGLDLHVIVPASETDMKTKLDLPLPVCGDLAPSSLKGREETSTGYENARICQRLEPVGSDSAPAEPVTKSLNVNTHPVSDGWTCPQPVSVGDSISHTQQTTKFMGALDTTVISAEGENLGQTMTTEHDDSGGKLDAGPITNPTGRKENARDSVEPEKDLDHISCDLKTSELMPSAVLAGQGVPETLCDGLQESEKLSRVSIANIQSKLDQLKRRSEVWVACETMPGSQLAQQLPVSSPGSDDPKGSETCAETVNTEPNTPSVASNSEALESKRLVAREPTATLSAASVDLVNSTCKLKRLPLGCFPAKLPNKRKSIIFASEDGDGRPDPLIFNSEMHASGGNMPDMLPVNVGPTCESLSILQERFPSCLEEVESNHSMNYEVPEGAWEELCEKEALHGQVENRFTPPRPCSGQKRALEQEEAEVPQKEKKRKEHFEWFGDSIGKQMTATCTNLSGSQTDVNTNTMSSMLARSLLKNNSTSSVDSRADGTMAELSNQCSQGDSRFLVDSSNELNLHGRFKDGILTVKEFFMLLNVGALIQKPRFSELPANYEANVRPTQEDLLRDQHIYRTKLQVLEEDCQALYQTMEELKLRVSAQDEPLANVNRYLWEAMKDCSEGELQLFGEEMKRMKSNYTLKSKVFSHKGKVKRYGKLLTTTQVQWDRLQSAIDDADRLVEELDGCISALHTEASELERSTQKSVTEWDARSMALKTELQNLESSEGARHTELLSLEEQKKSVLTLISQQFKVNASDKHLEQYNFSEWELSEWDEHCAIFNFLYNSIELSVAFGEPVAGVLFSGKPCRRISAVNFESFLNDESAPLSSLLVQRLVFQFIETKGPLHEKYRTMCDMPQFLFDISLVVNRCRLLGEEIEFLMKWGGKFNISKTEVRLAQVKLLFSSSEAFSKFEVSFYLSDNYPTAPLPFTVQKRIGKIGEDEISAVLSTVPQGPGYLTRAVKQINRKLLQVPSLLN